MIHEDRLECTKKEVENQKSARAALFMCYRFDHASVFGTRVFSASYYDGSIHSRGHLLPHGRRKKKYCAVNGLTCPCCSAAPLLLDCSPWTDSCCCIHSSVSLQKRNGEWRQFVIFAVWQIGEISRGKQRRRPIKFFRRPKCKCNSARCSLHFT